MVKISEIKENLEEGDWFYCTWSATPANINCSSIAFIKYNNTKTKLKIEQILIRDKELNNTTWNIDNTNIQRKATLVEINWFQECFKRKKYIEPNFSFNIKEQKTIIQEYTKLSEIWT